MSSDDVPSSPAQRTLVQPFAVECARTQNSTHVPVVDIETAESRSAKCRVPGNVKPTPRSLSEIWIPDSLLQEIAKRTNEYIASQNLTARYSYEKPVTPADICHCRNIRLCRVWGVSDFVYLA